jgi:dihydrofolate reductase
MGRNNFQSIPPKYSPLEGRTNIVVTRQRNFSAQGVIVVHSIEEALEAARNKNETECFIIGGGEIFSQTIDRCDRIYFTRIHVPFEGDVYFPVLNASEWKEISRRDIPADEKNNYPFTFFVYDRIK